MSSTPQKSHTEARPPIVAVVGHVDHGKSTLLDFIRKTNIVAREAGGITQSIGAYEVEHAGRKITFIDTPGHEAFSKMRERGARVADIAILVVAADDGVKPQTKEAIEILRKEKTPFVVAINKIDKNNADPERTKQSLLKEQVLLEKYGGDVSWVEISAKEGTGVNELLDHVLLMWEIDKPMYNGASSAKGFILEAERDSRKGIVVSVILTDGTIRTGETISTKTASGKIRTLEDFLGKRVQELKPSSPAVILGFNELPQIGEEFRVDERELEKEVLPKPQVRPDITPSTTEENKENVIKVILKADVSGSAEALQQVITHTPLEGKSIQVLSSEVGDITDTDVKNAETFGAYVIGFNVKPTKSAESYARGKNIDILLSNIIYRLVEDLQEKISHVGEEVPLGKLEVLATFSQKNKKQVIGGKVVEGYLTLNERFTIIRGAQGGEFAEVGRGRITNLQKGKNDVKKVEADEECGLMVESEATIEKGDLLVVEQNK